MVWVLSDGPCKLKYSYERTTAQRSAVGALNEKRLGGVADTGTELSVFILEMQACRLAAEETDP